MNETTGVATALCSSVLSKKDGGNFLKCRVWEVRLDVTVLNHSGNMLDACSIASIAALSHYKRPDVSVDDGKITIHPADEKAYIPLSILHMPICTSFSFFHTGNFVLLDASYDEERVMEGQMVVAMNKHREICALHMSGTHLLLKDQVSRCTNIAASKVLLITELIQTALRNDEELRTDGKYGGTAELSSNTKLESLIQNITKSLKFTPDPEKAATPGDSSSESDEGSESEAEMEIQLQQDDRVPANQEIGEGGLSSWGIEDTDMKSKGDANLSGKKKSEGSKAKRKSSKRPAEPEDSEEEMTVTLETL